MPKHAKLGPSSRTAKLVCYTYRKYYKQTDDAKKTLLLAEHYMEKLEQEAASLQHHSLADSQVKEYIHLLLPEPENASPIQQRNLSVLRTDLASRYLKRPI